MNGFELSKVNHEKDLGVTISNDLKPDKDCSDVVQKPDKLVSFIRKIFQYKSEKKSYPYTIQCTRTPSPRILQSI